MSDRVLQLRNTRLVDTLYRRTRDLLYGRGWGAFHRDRIYRSLMLDLLDTFAFTSFVETGTYRGYSSELVAVRHPRLPVFTVEVVESTYRRSARALKRYRNVTALLGTSNEAVRRLIAEGKVGEMPLYYLDAHWQSYWPLRDELRAISAAGGKAVIVIDDFEVPGEPQFGFDLDGGGDPTHGEKCNLDYIRPALSSPNVYRAIFPRYAVADAFASGGGPLRGHVVLFQNMSEEFERYLDRPLPRSYYFRHAAVVA